MLNFFIGFAFFEAGAFFGFFVAALLNAAHAGQEISIKFEESCKQKSIAEMKKVPQNLHS